MWLQGGILALDLELGKENIVFTAGADHTGQVYDCQANRIVASLTGHSKKVTGRRLQYACAVKSATCDLAPRMGRAFQESPIFANGIRFGFLAVLQCCGEVKHSFNANHAALTISQENYVMARSHSFSDTICAFPCHDSHV